MIMNMITITMIVITIILIIIFHTFPIQQVEGLTTAIIQGNKPTSKFNEVSRFHLHISWPVRQPRKQPTLRYSSQNTSTSRRSNTLTP